MAQQQRQRGSSIKKVTLADGSVRWRFRLDLDPGEDGKRRQRTLTFRTEEEAIREQSSARTEVAKGVYVEPDKRTVDDVLDAYLAAKALRWKAGTAYQNRSALEPMRLLLGDRLAQKLRRQDVDKAVAAMLKEGGRTGKGRSPKTVATSFTLLRAALDLGVRDGSLARNAAAGVELPSIPHTEQSTWSAEELRRFLAHVDGDRLVAAWHLAASGMRRGEILGARWSDVDEEKKVIHIRQARVLVGKEAVENAPKTKRSTRDVPLSATVLRALKLTRERTLAGGAVVPLRQRQRSTDGRLIVVDVDGQPMRPDVFSRRFQVLAEAAGLKRIRLHDVRHSVATLMLESGVQPHVVAGILGHDPAVLMRVYAHVTDRSAQAATDVLERAISGRL